VSDHEPVLRHVINLHQHTVQYSHEHKFLSSTSKIGLDDDSLSRKRAPTLEKSTVSGSRMDKLAV